MTKFSSLLFSPTFFRKWLFLIVQFRICTRTAGRVIELKSSMIFLAMQAAMELKKQGAGEIRPGVQWI
ncbi:MAG: hypothetical protein K1X78_23630 [Verrucomicrobiaceae bacterium]|nr:hypothetical protein [Verrucomicrobiaceae bacterium]